MATRPAKCCKACDYSAPAQNMRISTRLPNSIPLMPLIRSRQAMRRKPEADNRHMIAFNTKNKTIAAWLAFIFGQLGLHRFYLFGTRDIWAWLHPALAAFGWWGVYRVWLYGQDDQLAWLLIPLLGFTLAGTALTAIYYGLTTSEKWNAQHNPGAPQACAGNTNWLTIFAVVFALLFGTIALMSSIAFSFQRYFEYQAVIAPHAFHFV